MVPPNMHIDRQALAAFCRRWKVRGLALFRSVPRPNFRSDAVPFNVA